MSIIFNMIGSASTAPLDSEILTGDLTHYSNDRVTSIGDRTFQDCDSLTSVNLPSVISIGSHAFYNCPALTSVNFPAATSIGASAFYNCDLSIADFPLVTNIGYSAFFSCDALTSINFPAATSIGADAFRWCPSLTIADFPLVTNIGSYAFFDSVSLRHLVLRSETICTLSNTSAFQSTNFSSKGYIYVPSALIDSYKSATNWSSFSTCFRPLENYTVDGTITGMLNLVGDLKIDDGSIIITSTGYTLGEENVETPYTGVYDIYQNSKTALSNGIYVIGGEHNIVLAGVNLNGTKTITAEESFKLFGGIVWEYGYDDDEDGIDDAYYDAAYLNTLTVCGDANVSITLRGSSTLSYLDIVYGSSISIDGNGYLYTNQIGDDLCRQTGDLVINGGYIKSEGVSLDTLRMTGGTLDLAEGWLYYGTLDVIGGSIANNTDLPDTDSNGRVLTRLNFTIEWDEYTTEDVEWAGEQFTITEGDHTWTGETDENGQITTYLAVDNNGASHITVRYSSYGSYEAQATITGGNATITVS